jgi:hypothetical protein
MNYSDELYSVRDYIGPSFLFYGVPLTVVAFVAGAPLEYYGVIFAACLGHAAYSALEENARRYALDFRDAQEKIEELKSENTLLHEENQKLFFKNHD